MILIDYSQLFMSVWFSLQSTKPDFTIEDVRFNVINTIRSRVNTHKEKFGNVILCIDSRKNWRKHQFKEYKANRKKDDPQYEILYEQLNIIRDEIKEQMTWPVLGANGAEADDVIAVICKHYGVREAINYGSEEICICSPDKDFEQLYKYSNVTQWNPSTKKFKQINNPMLALKYLILKGDTCDGVPNFLSDDDTFINPDKRQKSLFKTKLSKWLDMAAVDILEETGTSDFYNRNQRMIDFEYIPQSIQSEIISNLNNYQYNEINKTIEYFNKHNFVGFLSQIEDFKYD